MHFYYSCSAFLVAPSRIDGDCEKEFSVRAEIFYLSSQRCIASSPLSTLLPVLAPNRQNCQRIIVVLEREL